MLALCKLRTKALSYLLFCELGNSNCIVFFLE
jgi:hypothetical protein